MSRCGSIGTTEVVPFPKTLFPHAFPSPHFPSHAFPLPQAFLSPSISFSRHSPQAFLSQEAFPSARIFLPGRVAIFFLRSFLRGADGATDFQIFAAAGDWNVFPAARFGLAR